MVWLLKEAGVEFEKVPVPIADQEAKAKVDPDFFNASPMGKVPALADGEVKLADSAAIALYVADRYPQAGLAPAIDHPDRGRYLYWMTFAPGVIEPAMGEYFSKVEPNPGPNAWGSFDIMIKTLEAHVPETGWMLGERFSAADVMIGSSIVFMRLFGLPVEAAHLNAYADRCLARPAYAAALAEDQAAAEAG